MAVFQAFIFIMLTILGNSDVSVIYTVAPLLGSLPLTFGGRFGWILGCSKYQTYIDWMHMLWSFLYKLHMNNTRWVACLSSTCTRISWYLVFWGSLLIIIYVVGIFFVIMNLFYAIIVSTLSDAKIEEDAKQKKKWAVMQDRLEDTWKAGRKHVMWWLFWAMIGQDEAVAKGALNLLNFFTCLMFWSWYKAIIQSS